MNSNSHGSRTIEANISVSNIKDQVSALLYATGYVYDNEDIVHLDIGAFTPGAETVPLKFTIKKHQEARLIKHNG